MYDPKAGQTVTLGSAVIHIEECDGPQAGAIAHALIGWLARYPGRSVVWISAGDTPDTTKVLVAQDGVEILNTRTTGGAEFAAFLRRQDGGR